MPRTKKAPSPPTRKPRADKRIMLRVTAAELARWESAAAADQRALGDWLRTAAEEKAKKSRG